MYPPQGKSLYKFLPQFEALRCAAGEQGCRAKDRCGLDFLFLPVYPGLCKRVLESSLVYPSLETGVFQHMVSENEFAAPSSHDFEMILPNKILDWLEFWLLGHKIVAGRVEPKPFKSGIVNKDTRSARCIRPLFKFKNTRLKTFWLDSPRYYLVT